jgi:hypothetical protein
VNGGYGGIFEVSSFKVQSMVPSGGAPRMQVFGDVAEQISSQKKRPKED